MVVQSARAVKRDKKNARELGEREGLLFFPPSPPSQIAWLVLLLSESLAESTPRLAV